jgi:hypothetical protein
MGDCIIEGITNIKESLDSLDTLGLHYGREDLWNLLQPSSAKDPKNPYGIHHKECLICWQDVTKLLSVYYNFEKKVFDFEGLNNILWFCPTCTCPYHVGCINKTLTIRPYPVTEPKKFHDSDVNVTSAFRCPQCREEYNNILPYSSTPPKHKHTQLHWEKILPKKGFPRMLTHFPFPFHYMIGNYHDWPNSGVLEIPVTTTTTTTTTTTSSTSTEPTRTTSTSNHILVRSQSEDEEEIEDRRDNNNEDDEEDNYVSEELL